MSKIIKAPFVSMSEIRKEIKRIDPKDPKIIKTAQPEEAEGPVEEISEYEETTEEEAIDDQVIDGSPSMVLKMAREEAELLLEDAKARALQIEAEAKEQGYEAGYNEGRSAAEETLNEKEAGLEARALQLEEAYQTQLQEKASEIAGIIMDLVRSLVGRTVVEEDVIVYIVRLALQETTALGSFIVRVSPEDYETVVMNGDSLMAGLSEKVDIEVLKDNGLSANDCLIETDLGIINGSLKVRMTGLEKELRLIGDSLRFDKKE